MNPGDARVALFPAISAAATRCGYALGVHESFGGAMELIAAPWVPEACAGEKLIQALAASIGLPESQVYGPFNRPFGRLGYALCVASDMQFLVNVIPRYTVFKIVAPALEAQGAAS